MRWMHRFRSAGAPDASPETSTKAEPARPRPRLRWLLLAGLLALLVLVGTPPAVALLSTSGERYPADQAPNAPVAIVLGAGLDGSGRPSLFLSERIAVAAQLYHRGAVRALLMSGDNSRRDYDEVGVMAAEAQRLGVPGSAIVQDHAGFDTYSSCYRARSVWGIHRAVLVSQPFHLARAVWTCRRLGVQAIGAATRSDDGLSVTWYGWLREIPATDKAVVDVLRGRQPTFPGPREHSLDAINAAG
jgi:vancomycin permeability regulator SanA